jgi:hypothetical protein
MYDIPRIIRNNHNVTVQFMTTCEYKDHPFAYCCDAKVLYDDWMDEANHCPQNHAKILMCTFYTADRVWPLESIGLDECADFELLMMKIEEGLNMRRE